jgi:hypothetical protein
MEEIWKDIKGYEGIYQVSNLGRVYSLISKKVLTVFKTDTYVKVNLKRKSYNVHRLVSVAFIPNPKNKPQVNHIDGDKHNNKINNLEWVTAKENVEHAIKNGFIDNTKKAHYGTGHPLSKKIYRYDLEGNFIDSWDYIRECAIKLSLSENQISRVINKENGSCGGFQFRKYKKDKINKYERKWKNRHGEGKSNTLFN